MQLHVLLRTALVAVACTCPAAFADEPEDPEPVAGAMGAAPAPAEGDAAAGAEAVAADANTLPLSLDEAIRLGLQNNLGVQIQRFDPLIAEEDVRIAWGAYDPIWESELGWNSERLPTTSQFDTADIRATKTLDGEGGFVGVLPFLSTQYSAKLDSQRVMTNYRIVDVSPEYRSTTVFSLTQPLLRDLIWNEPWTRVKVGKIGHASSLESFRRDVMEIVQRIENSYWNLIASREEMQVAEKSLETSRALLEQTRTQYEVGVVSKVEVVQAEAGVADREFNLIVVKNGYRQAQDDLIDQVLGTQLRAETTLSIEPTDKAEEYVSYELDVEESARVAFARRPELVLAEQEIERLAIEEKFAKNQRLPQLDVVGSYSYQGLSGRDNPDCIDFDTGLPCVSGLAPDYGDSYDKFYDPNGANNWSVRGILSIPIPNTAARHRYTQAQIELRRAHTSKRRVEQDIILEVRSAVRNILSAQEGIEAAERAVAAAAEQLRAEQIRLEYGESTPFDVLQREDDLVQAASQRIQAFRTYHTSLTALDRSQGTILRNRNIAIDQILAMP